MTDTIDHIDEAKPAEQKPVEPTLWVTDAELIRRMGVPEKIARDTLRFLDDKPSGFPRKVKLWGDRRYWPAVKAYFDAQYAGNVAVPQRRTGS